MVLVDRIPETVNIKFRVGIIFLKKNPQQLSRITYYENNFCSSIKID